MQPQTMQRFDFEILPASMDPHELKAMLNAKGELGYAVVAFNEDQQYFVLQRQLLPQEVSLVGETLNVNVESLPYLKVQPNSRGGSWDVEMTNGN